MCAASENNGIKSAVPGYTGLADDPDGLPYL